MLQYFAGADRANPRVAKLHDPLQPAFLRLLNKIVADVHAGGKRVGVCGEMAGQTRCLPLLVGLGVDEISAAPSAITPLKAELVSWPAPVCRELAQRALACAAAEEVRQLLDDWAARSPAPLVAQDMIVVQSESLTKEEAIKEVVDKLYVLGRTEQPHALEDAIWRRESLYSTGFGHGFAIPHCKTPAIAANSLVLLKLRHPVAWDWLDGQPATVMVMLVIQRIR